MKILPFFLFILFFSQEICAQKNFKKGGTRSAIVEVVKANKTKLYSLIPASGRVISLEPYSIISKVNEEVKKIFVLEGEEVFKGQTILELETKNIKRMISRYKEEIKFNNITLKLLNEEILIVNDKLKRFLDLTK